MEFKITWKKKWISSNYELYKDNRLIGDLVTKPFSTSATGQLHNINLRFQMRGFLNQKTEIVDTNTNKTIGNITYNTLKTRASIQLYDEIIEWRSLNWNNTKWGITNGSIGIANSWNRMFSGEIISRNENPIYILLGMFIAEYFSRSTVAIFVALFVIIIAGS